MNVKNYNYLVGKSCEEVTSILGEEFNDYYGSVWSYQVGRSWWGRWELMISFVEDKVGRLEIKKKVCLF